jgi:hypothetical protein
MTISPSTSGLTHSQEIAKIQLPSLSSRKRRPKFDILVEQAQRPLGGFGHVAHANDNRRKKQQNLRPGRRDLPHRVAPRFRHAFVFWATSIWLKKPCKTHSPRPANNGRMKAYRQIRAPGWVRRTASKQSTPSAGKPASMRQSRNK